MFGGIGSIIAEEEGRKEKLVMRVERYRTLFPNLAPRKSGRCRCCRYFVGLVGQV